MPIVEGATIVMLNLKEILASSIALQEDASYDAPDQEAPPARARRAIETLVSRGINTAEMLIGVASDRDEDTSLRIEVISFLRVLGLSESVEALMSLARSESEPIPVRRAAIAAIYSFHLDSTLEIMRPMLLDEPLEEVRLSVVSGFALFPQSGLCPLLENVAFSDQSSRVRGEAIRQLAIYCSKGMRNDVFDILVKKLQEQGEDVTVKAYAIEGFAHILDSRGLAIALSALSDPAPAIRLMAAYSVGHLGDSRHISQLRDMVNDRGVFEGFGTVNEEVVQAIERLQYGESGSTSH